MGGERTLHEDMRFLVMCLFIYKNKKMLSADRGVMQHFLIYLEPKRKAKSLETQSGFRGDVRLVERQNACQARVQWWWWWWWLLLLLLLVR